MANNAGAVVIAKGKASGYAFYAPEGTVIAADPSAELDKACLPLGYVSSDGIANAFKTDSDDKKDLNGDVVATVRTSRSETFKFSLMQTDDNTLKIVYGQDNVSTDATSTVRTVKHNGNTGASHAYVFRLVTKDTDTDQELTDIVVPNGVVDSVDDITYSGTDIVTYKLTIKALPDASGNTAYMYTKTVKKS